MFEQQMKMEKEKEKLKSQAPSFDKEKPEPFAVKAVSTDAFISAAEHPNDMQESPERNNELSRPTKRAKSDETETSS